MQIQFTSLSQLKPKPNNPRHHPPPQIRKMVECIRTIGFRVPISVDKDFNIISGNGRYQAAVQLKLKVVPTIQHIDLDPEQASALSLADNRLAELSEWKQDCLEQELKKLEHTDWQSLAGFDLPEVEMLVLEQKKPARMNFTLGWCDKHPKIGNKAIKKSNQYKLNIQKKAQLGTLFQLGKHRLLCGDAKQPTDYQQLCQGELANMVFTDPPFNLRNNDFSFTEWKFKDFCEAGGELTATQFQQFLASAVECLKAHSTPASLHYIFMDWRHALDILSVGQQKYSRLHNICVWNKLNPGLGSFYKSAHEMAFVFKHSNQTHTNNIQLGKYGRNRTNVWDYPNGKVEGLDTSSSCYMHPTVKPVEMMVEAIKDCTHPGQLVLDPFVGSGTTLIAAEQTKRVCYAMDKSPEYCDLTIARWEQLTGKKAVEVEYATA